MECFNSSRRLRRSSTSFWTTVLIKHNWCQKKRHKQLSTISGPRENAKNCEHVRAQQHGYHIIRLSNRRKEVKQNWTTHKGHKGRRRRRLTKIFFRKRNNTNSTVKMNSTKIVAMYNYKHEAKYWIVISIIIIIITVITTILINKNQSYCKYGNRNHRCTCWEKLLFIKFKFSPLIFATILVWEKILTSTCTSCRIQHKYVQWRNHHAQKQQNLFMEHMCERINDNSDARSFIPQ